MPLLGNGTYAPFGQAGEVRQAYELLALIYGWFTEGFDTLPLRGLDTLPSERGSTGHFRAWHFEKFRNFYFLNRCWRTSGHPIRLARLRTLPPC